MARRSGARGRPWPLRVLAGLGCVLALAAGICGWLVGSALGAGLADGRGYELVSAVDKNGGDVVGDPARVRVADDGSAVGYASLTEFGDSVGGGVATDYVSVRSPQAGGQGWVTHGVIPPQPAPSFQGILDGLEPRYEQDYAPDLSSGVLLAWRPLTSDPLVANVANLYLRDDLRRCGRRALPVGDGVPVVPRAAQPRSDHRGAVDGCEHAGSGPGAVRVGAEPRGGGGGQRHQALSVGCGQPPRRAGRHPAGRQRGAGLRGRCRAWALRASPCDLRRWPQGLLHGQRRRDHNVYMRLDQSSTVLLNRSELTPTPAAAQSAQYGDASVDGSRVFFTSGEQLTTDAPAGGRRRPLRV